MEAVRSHSPFYKPNEQWRVEFKYLRRGVITLVDQHQRPKLVFPEGFLADFEKERKIYINLLLWIVGYVDLCKYGLPTLYMTAQLIDRYCLKKGPLMKEDAQLVGYTCFWIASKFHEVVPADANGIEPSFTEEQVIAKELEILLLFEWDIWNRTCYDVWMFIWENQEEEAIPFSKQRIQMICLLLENGLFFPHQNLMLKQEDYVEAIILVSHYLLTEGTTIPSSNPIFKQILGQIKRFHGGKLPIVKERYKEMLPFLNKKFN